MFLTVPFNARSASRAITVSEARLDKRRITCITFWDAAVSLSPPSFVSSAMASLDSKSHSASAQLKPGSMKTATRSLPK